MFHGTLHALPGKLVLPRPGALQDVLTIGAADVGAVEDHVLRSGRSSASFVGPRTCAGSGGGVEGSGHMLGLR